jgi:hypothetical protein
LRDAVEQINKDLIEKGEKTQRKKPAAPTKTPEPKATAKAPTPPADKEEKDDKAAAGSKSNGAAPEAPKADVILMEHVKQRDTKKISNYLLQALGRSGMQRLVLECQGLLDDTKPPPSMMPPPSTIPEATVRRQ